MRILVTGASGFMGRALCHAAREKGHDVHALSRNLDRLDLTGELDVTRFRGGVGDPDEVARAAEGCDVVFHTSGVARPPCPDRVARWLHVAGTENVLSAARHAGVRRVVLFSCADVTLHDGDRLHWDELRTLPGRSVGAHAQSKLVAEELALARSDDDLEITALRPAWLWGKGDYDGLAYLHARSRGRGLALPGGGRNLLATAHVDTVLSAAFAAATAEKAPGRAYHVSDGDFVEAREFLAALSQAAGLPPPRTGLPMPVAVWSARVRSALGLGGASVDEVLRLGRGALFDLSRASEDLGYTPAVDTAAAMHALTEWVREAGGIEAIARAASPAARDADVDAQVALAGGD